jgi:hypothetical protein
VIDNAGNEWQFPPIPSIKLHKLTRMAHWLTPEDFFGGRPPTQISLRAGEARLRHLSLEGEELGTSIRHGDQGPGRRFVIHLDAAGQEIAVLSMVSDEPPRKSLLGRLLFKNTIWLNDRVRYELRTANGGELSLAHSKAGRYLRYKGFGTPGGT